MLFKSVPYRLGSGKNLHGRCDGDDGFKLLYYFEDEGGGKVLSKIVKRRAGYLEVTRGSEVIDAVEAVWLGTRYFISRGEKQVKTQADV